MLLMQPVVVNDALAAERPVAAEVRVAERAVEPPRWTGLLLAENPTDQRSPFGTNAPNANDGTPDFAPPNPPATAPRPDQEGKGPLTDPTSTKVPPAPSRPDAGPPPPTGKFTNHTDTVGPLAQGTVPGTTTNTPGAATTPGTTTPGAFPGTTMPGTTPTTATPGTTPSTATPGTTPGTATPGLGGSSGSMTVPGTTTPGFGGASGTMTTPGATTPSPTSTPGAIPSPNSSPTTPGGIPVTPPPQSGSTAPPTLPGASSGASNTR